MFYHLKPWQLFVFHSYASKWIQTKKSFDIILSLNFDLEPLKMNTYYIRKNQVCKKPSKGLI